MTILMRQPNLLVMDEPTNDLDIVTINILEEYLKTFKGTLVLVSHDRHFLDRLVDHLFVFSGDGAVKDFVGSYSQYNAYLKDIEAAKRAKAKEEARKNVPARRRPVADETKPRKLSFKEKRELETLEKEIAGLNEEKAALEVKMNGGTADYDELRAASARFGEISALLDEKETRWLELSISST